MVHNKARYKIFHSFTYNTYYFIPGLDGILARQLNQTSAFGAWVLIKISLINFKFKLNNVYVSLITF